MRYDHVTNADEDRTSGYCCSVCGRLAPVDITEDLYMRRFRGRNTGRDFTLCYGCWQTGTEIDIAGDEL